MARYIRRITKDKDVTKIAFGEFEYTFMMYPDEDDDNGSWISDDDTIASQVKRVIEKERFYDDFDREVILDLIEEIDLADEFDIPELLEQLEEYEGYMD